MIHADNKTACEVSANRTTVQAIMHDSRPTIVTFT